MAFLITATFVRGIPHDLTLLVQLLAVLLSAGVGILAWVVMYKQHAHAVQVLPGTISALAASV